jgi:hypothetical protein
VLHTFYHFSVSVGVPTDFKLIAKQLVYENCLACGIYFVVFCDKIDATGEVIYTRSMKV